MQATRWCGQLGSHQTLQGNHPFPSVTSGTCTIVSPEGERKWAVAPNPAKSLCQKQVNGSFILHEGQFICSESAQFRFGVFDGDLSLWEYNYLRWSASACCSRTGAQMQLLENGKLVLVNDTENELWDTKTSESFGASLRLGDDGQPQLVSPSGKVLWKVGGSKAMGASGEKHKKSRPNVQRLVSPPSPTQTQSFSSKGPGIPLASPTQRSASHEAQTPVVPSQSFKPVATSFTASEKNLSERPVVRIPS